MLEWKRTLLQSQKILEVKLTIQEGDCCGSLPCKTKARGSGGAVVHLFRFQNDLIVEFWDVGQPIPVNSPNENGVF